MALSRHPHYLSRLVRQTTRHEKEGRVPNFTRLFIGLCAFSLVGCERPPAPETLKEWTPIDHHSQDDNKIATGSQASGSSAPKGSGGGDAQLVDIAWRQQCASCHGPMGKGDGQMGPMVQAPDLSRDDWQAKVTDAEMAATIKSGKNRMPKFDLPDTVLRGLVARIRTLRGR
jgi:Cytochrome C oxidase, cbb3-type, subunit III